MLQVGAISTGTVIILGIFLVVPVFFPPAPKLPVLLIFDVTENNNLPNWCDQLSTVLKKHDVSAAVFVTGKVAEEYPQCVTDFSDKVDIGSETYDYTDLVSLGDYSKELEEVEKGKLAVDTAGNLESKLFRAPNGSVDGNIYSLLDRSNILADFSYQHQFNKYYNDKFIKFDLNSYSGTNTSANLINSLSPDAGPVSIYYDNSVSVEKIETMLSELDTGKVKFVNASDLAGIDLTVRGGFFAWH